MGGEGVNRGKMENETRAKVSKKSQARVRGGEEESVDKSNHSIKS